MLNNVASFFRFTIPPSKNDVLQRKTRTKQKCFSLHGNNVPLFFAIHPSGCNDGEKAKQEYSAEDYAAIMVTSKDGAKSQRDYSPGYHPGFEFIN